MGVKKLVKAVRNKDKEERTEAELEAKRLYKEAKKHAKEERKLAKQEYKEEKRQRKEMESELREADKLAEKEIKKHAKSIRESKKPDIGRDVSMPLLLSDEFSAWSDSFVEFDAEQLEAARTDFLDQQSECSNSMSRSEMSGSRGGSQRRRQNFSSRRRDGGGSRSRSPRRRSPSPLREVRSRSPRAGKDGCSPSPLRDIRSRSPRAGRDGYIPDHIPCSVEKFLDESSNQDFSERRSTSPTPNRPKIPPRRAKSDLAGTAIPEDNHHHYLVQDNITDWSPTNPDWVPVRGSVNPAVRRLRGQQQQEWIRNGAPDPDPMPRKNRSKSAPKRKTTAPSRIPRESIANNKSRSLSPKRSTPIRSSSDHTADRMNAPERLKLAKEDSITAHDWQESTVSDNEEKPETEPKVARPAPVSMRARSVDSALLADGFKERKSTLRQAHLVF